MRKNKFNKNIEITSLKEQESLSKLKVLVEINKRRY